MFKKTRHERIIEFVLNSACSYFVSKDQFKYVSYKLVLLEKRNGEKEIYLPLNLEEHKTRGLRGLFS